MVERVPLIVTGLQFKPSQRKLPTAKWSSSAVPGPANAKSLRESEFINPSLFASDKSVSEATFVSRCPLLEFDSSEIEL